ncbi:DUF445 family protein [Priestia megaterium]|nr:DUF445 family protein [Priestia megaterium]
MEQLVIVLIMALIGAAIGGVTNHLAIKMLFHPYEAKYLFGKRIPFTPGLIPKRRDELAVQLGKMVVEHLVTPESLKKKLQEPSFQQILLRMANNALEKVFTTDRTLKEAFDMLGIENANKQTENFVHQLIEQKYVSFMNEKANVPLKQFLTEGIKAKADDIIPLIAQQICDKAVLYFESEDGKRKLEKMLDDFLMKKGMLGNMIQMFLGNAKVIDKVQPEVIKFFNHEGTRELFETLIQNEWSKLQEKNVIEAEQLIGRTTILNGLHEVTKRLLSLNSLFNRPLNRLLAPFYKHVEKAAPVIVEKAGVFLVSRIDSLMDQLKLEDVVREQVESFSVARIEELILGISRREFKMITYLGALLGGIIGVIQGIFALFIQ